MSAVRIDHLHKQFGGNVILPDFSLDVAQGEFVALLGPSGCGKTTVLRCVAGLEPASGGRISIGDVVVEDGARGISVPPRDRRLGFVFQHYALWPHMSVEENVAYPMRVRGVPQRDYDGRVQEILAAMGLDELGRRSPSELSGGQQQRVALARALVGAPQLLLLDEPLSNLDAQRRNSLRKQLRELHRTLRTTTLYVTHDQSEALTLADRVVLMRAGHIEQIGTPRDIFSNPANRFVADFLGYENILPARVTGLNGRFATVSSTAWNGDFAVETAIPVRVGTVVEVAFRATNVSIHAAADAAPSPAARSVRMDDAIFLGDSVEYSLAADGDRIVARVPSKSAFATDAIGSTMQMSLLPEHVVMLGPAQDGGASSRHYPANPRMIQA